MEAATTLHSEAFHSQESHSAELVNNHVLFHCMDGHAVTIVILLKDPARAVPLHILRCLFAF